MSKKNLTPDQKKKRRRRLIFGLIGAAILIVILIIIFRPKATTTGTIDLPAFTVETRDLSTTIELTGTIKNSYLTDVNTKAEGIITAVYVQNGQQVKAGDKLFEIELSPESKQSAQTAYNSYLNAQNNAASAKAQLNTSKSTLFNKNQYFIDHALEEDLDPSDPTYIQQESDWLAAEANYKVQEQKISVTNREVSTSYQNYQQYASTVTAPTAGEVMGVAITEGMTVSNSDDTSQRLAVIKSGSTLVVQVDVSEMDIADVAVGQTAEIEISSVKNQIFQGEVISIDQVGTSNSNTGASYPVLVSFTAPETVTILPNMSADVTLYVSQVSETLAVPTVALQQENGQYYVDLITQPAQGKTTAITQRQAVTIGAADGTYTQITTGLNAGDQIQMADFNRVINNFSSGNSMFGSMAGGGGPGGGGTATVVRTGP